MKKLSFSLLSLAVFLLLPDLALASGIGQFTAPLEAVQNTLTGPAGKAISIFAMALCGIIFIIKRDDLTGGFQLLLGVVFGISFIAFAGGIVGNLFTFSGAVI